MLKQVIKYTVPLLLLLFIACSIDNTKYIGTVSKEYKPLPNFDLRNQNDNQINQNSFSDVVKEIDIKGNNRISNETIIVFGDISVGKDYTISDVNILIKKLYATSFFSDISASIENDTLKIVVKENPIINEIIPALIES